MLSRMSVQHTDDTDACGVKGFWFWFEHGVASLHITPAMEKTARRSAFQSELDMVSFRVMAVKKWMNTNHGEVQCYSNMTTHLHDVFDFAFSGDSEYLTDKTIVSAAPCWILRLRLLR